MTIFPADPQLAQWAEAFDRTGWATAIVDSNFEIVWVSDELQYFLEETDPERLGYGKNIIEAFLSETWSSHVPFESQMRMFNDFVPYLLGDERTKQGVVDRLPEPFSELTAGLEPRPLPFVMSSWFGWQSHDLPEYRVDIVATRIHDHQGTFLGVHFTAFMGVKPSLLTLLALGDQSMYERMAKLIEPERRQAAILFADLESSGALSRQLPTVQYFRLIQQFTTCVDQVVAGHTGITGKHAGDGATAFFLSEDLGSPSAAARDSILAARQMQDLVADLDIATNADAGRCVLNIGLHWGSGLYMGQLVPGGRLDVTALGDEVNECARIQEAASNGGLIASKSLVEQLNNEDAARAGVDPEKLGYRPLGEMPGASDKAKQDAGGLPVTTL